MIAINMLKDLPLPPQDGPGSSLQLVERRVYEMKEMQAGSEEDNILPRLQLKLGELVCHLAYTILYVVRLHMNFSAT